MNDIRVIIAFVLGMLLIERLLVVSLTKREGGKAFFRKMVILHPNAISIMRLPMGILSAWFASMGHWTLATLWFAFWMITDLSDGTIARNCDLGTESGKWLDPLSDKFMYFPPLIYLSAGSVCSWGLTILPFSLVAFFVVLDVLGQLSRLWVKKKAANSFGKAKTALVTVVLSVISLNQIQQIRFGSFVLLNERFVFFLMLFCTLLAFMSFYCKVIPDIWYANSLILLNYLCGVGCVILSAMAFINDRQGYYAIAFSLIFLGQFFDLFDGRLAQKFGSTPYGDVLDEIADAANYGCGGAAIIFFSLAFGEELVPWQVATCVAAIYWGVALFNLFRFRHSAAVPQPGLFCGLPVSAGAALACSSVLLGLEFPQPLFGIISVVIVVTASILMASKLPYRHFGLTIWPNQPRMVKLLICIVALVIVCLALSHRPLRFIFVSGSLLVSILYAVFGLEYKRNKGKNF